MSNYNNLAQKTNYTAGSDKLDLAHLYLTSVNIPGVNLAHPEVSGRSGARLVLPGDALTFNSLSFELLVDEDFQIYHEFMGKVFENINPISGEFANVEFDFWVQINNSKGNKLFKMEFHSCRVESVSDIQLDTTDDMTEFTLPIEIKYDYFSIDKGDGAIPVLRT
jgi:hypothetical protein